LVPGSCSTDDESASSSSRSRRVAGDSGLFVYDSSVDSSTLHMNDIDDPIFQVLILLSLKSTDAEVI
jgi:hypothetical protein